jgi:cell division protein ZapA
MSREPVRVHIFNQTYSLLTESDPREVQEIAHQVDELMSNIAGRTGSGDSARIAVLACLHLADKLRNAERVLQKYEDKSEKITELLEQTLLEESFDQ